MEADQIVKLLENVLDAKLKPLKEDISDIGLNVTNLKEDVGNIKLDVSNLKEDVSNIKLDVSNLKEDVSNIKLDVSNLKEDVGNIKLDVSNLNDKLDMLAAEQPNDTLAILQIIDSKLDSIQKDVEFTYFKTSKNELEINRLKTQ